MGHYQELEGQLDEVLSLVHEAILQLKRGDTADALTTLERTAFPKWHSESASFFELTAHNDNKEAALGAVA